MSNTDWVRVQTKTFTKWCNHHLSKKGAKIEDLTSDFKSGLNLIKLLETIGETTFPKYNKNPRLRIQMIENVKIALEFIESRGVKLTAIGGEDIVDGNLKLILGTIWTVILRFQIAEIRYNDVDVKNFTWSWQDGLAFCALIHKHRPDLIDFDSLSKANKGENLQLAFDVAENELGIPKFLDVEDMVDVKPDEKAVMAYLYEYFKYFSKGLKAETAARRISKVITLVKQLNEQKAAYDERSQNFNNTINSKISELDDHSFPETIDGVKKSLDEFKAYKKDEKPQLGSEKMEIESDFNQLQTRLKVNNRNPYEPEQGLSIEDNEELWNKLEQSEQERSKALRDKLQKLNRALLDEYEQAAADFNNWVNEEKQALQGVSGDLNQQADQIRGMIEDIVANKSRLQRIEELSREVERQNLEYYTEVTFDVLANLYDQLLSYARQQLSLLENQIKVKEGAKVTQEQLKEFQTMFEHFDKDKKGGLLPYEFQGVLKSLGDELDDVETKKVFDKYDTDGNGTIDFDEFVDFMVKRTEDSDTAEQIKESWRVLSSSQPQVTETQMKTAGMKPDIVGFAVQTMPPAGDGYDFIDYTDNFLYK
ncbi:spectrin beta chain [Anaeramoeba ignava]|uniref:Spectrin beta chain n=1 Tax=Anaeramoeba ignava TaxID=1746090 RepID=A0A9Q0RFL4_ANAIG|nr:spectrin beta chain [Anaeramoeba ignava]